MLARFFHREQLVELDNIMDNVIILAQCFIANRLLQPKKEAIDRYKRDGEPLTLSITQSDINDTEVEYKGVISDKESRVIGTMCFDIKNGQVHAYDIALKGILKGRKLAISKSTRETIKDRVCYVLDVTNTLQRLIDAIEEHYTC